MKRRLPRAHVEARVRAALEARSKTWTDPVLPGGAAGPAPLAGAPPRTQAGRRKPAVAVGAGAAAAVVVLVAAAVVLRSGPTGDGDVVASDESRDPLPAIPMPAEPEGPAAPCESELPMQVDVQDATGPHAGPAPGFEEALPHQLVVHWLRDDGAVEVRWPATPRPFYDLDGGPARRDLDDEGGADGWATSDDPPALVVDLTHEERGDADVAASPMPGAGEDVERMEEDVVMTGTSETGPPCDVVQLTYPTPEGDQRAALRLAFSEIAPGSPILMPYQPVPIEPLVVERRPVDDAPDPVVPCGDGDPSYSGGPDPALQAATPVEVLDAFVNTHPGHPGNRFVEMVEPDGTVTYGIDESDEGWALVVRVVEGADGRWHLDGWSSRYCRG